MVQPIWIKKADHRELGPLLRVRWISRHFAVSFDHLVSAGEERGWNREAERLRRPKVDDKLESRRLLNRKVRRIGTPENAVNIICAAPREGAPMPLPCTAAI
jgi:hypothetical protein